jgi:hypothetical protein
MARALISTTPERAGVQIKRKRCQDFCLRGPTSAFAQLRPPSKLNSTHAMSESAHAQPHTSTGTPLDSRVSGAGATMIDSGNSSQTGFVAAVA